MVDKVQLIDKDRVATFASVFHTLCRLSLRYKDDGNARSAARWEGDQTPYHAKKARRLSYSPTDVDMV